MGFWDIVRVVTTLAASLIDRIFASRRHHVQEGERRQQIAEDAAEERLKQLERDLKEQQAREQQAREQQALERARQAQESEFRRQLEAQAEDRRRSDEEHNKQAQRQQAEQEARDKAQQELIDDLAKKAERAQKETEAKAAALAEAQKEANRDFPAHRKKPAELIRLAKQDIMVNFHCFIHFAFCGFSGQGKSSLINAIRGIRNASMPGYAPVNQFESLVPAKNYQLAPPRDHILVWDMPGGGCAENPGRTYWEDKLLAVFDFLVIVVDGRFSELSQEIVRIATVYYQKRVAIIKTQAERHVESMKRENGLSEAEAIERLRVGHRQDVARNFRASNIEVPLDKIDYFVVSAWKMVDQPGYADNDQFLAWIAELSRIPQPEEGIFP